MEQYKYNPSDYVDYLCESMTNFYAALPAANAIDLSCIWQRIFFDTKQAMKERFETGGLSFIMRCNQAYGSYGRR